MVNCNKIIEDVGVLPVINITQLEQAVPLAKVLMADGMDPFEVYNTFGRF